MLLLLLLLSYLLVLLLLLNYLPLLLLLSMLPLPLFLLLVIDSYGCCCPYKKNNYQLGLQQVLPGQAFVHTLSGNILSQNRGRKKGTPGVQFTGPNPALRRGAVLIAIEPTRG